MNTQRVSLQGWKAWERRRRKELRAAGGLDLARASHIALHEVRCRARIAMVLGRPRAKELRLTLCLSGLYDDPQFLLLDRITWQLWNQLAEIPGLLYPFGRHA